MADSRCSANLSLNDVAAKGSETELRKDRRRLACRFFSVKVMVVMSNSGHPSIQMQVDDTLVTVRFVGHVTEHSMQEHLVRVVALANGIPAGFTLLTDLTDLDQMDFGCAAILAKIMDRFRECGVGQIIRIIPNKEKDIGFKILSYFHYEPGISITTVESVTEARSLLAQSGFAPK